MPRKVKKITASQRKASAKSQALKSSDSYKSLLYGIATVIILFIVGFGVVKVFVSRPKPAIDNKAVSIQNLGVTGIDSESTGTKKQNTGKGTYTVKAGESLWSIAEKEYKDGYKWTEIAKANNIARPSTIFKDDKLVIPAEVITPTPVQQTLEAGTEQKVNGTTYVIKRGDDLWGIAVRAYGDGYKWVDIARENNLENPNLIHADNVLKLPRK